MNRKEFIKKATKKMKAKYPGNRISEREVSVWVREIIECIRECALTEDKLVFPGLGAWKRRVSPSRCLYNLQAGGGLKDYGPRIKIEFSFSEEIQDKIAKMRPSAEDYSSENEDAANAEDEDYDE